MRGIERENGTHRKDSLNSHPAKALLVDLPKANPAMRTAAAVQETNFRAHSGGPVHCSHNKNAGSRCKKYKEKHKNNEMSREKSRPNIAFIGSTATRIYLPDLKCGVGLRDNVIRRERARWKAKKLLQICTD
jgi:hypothetical protein